MKRTKHLFEEVWALENLHLAYLKARRGKQGRPVPNGVYLVRVAATTEEGEGVEAVRTVRVRR